ncbi:hypothetical protein D3C80_1727020 [compost metagenome]
MRAISDGPKFSTKPSLVRRVNVRTRCVRSSASSGRSTASASCTSALTRSRNASARGVGTRPRPALTNSGSPMVSRKRARARLMAEGLRCRRWAARATLPSSSNTFSVISRFRSAIESNPVGASWLAVLLLVWRQMHVVSATAASSAMLGVSLVSGQPV